ncbi:MAG TPA: nicotinate phosphoribosyltransferase [Pirellulales bacterium]|nr:nicotinate phosphoribosyltransferase [Pirellulales bacterium]
MQPISNALATDLYQLTMLQCYHRAGLRDVAVFDLFVRRLPHSRNFLIAAGLEQALELLESLRFSREELDWLAKCGHLQSEFVERLADWRFTGDVDALPEGTIFFADEPVLRVTAPIEQAQFVESRLLNLVHFQTLIASKAVRSVLAAQGKPLVDFGFRRSHGAEAGILAARAAYIAGFAGTATVAAGRDFEIPLFGTMAHSLVQAIGDDASALVTFARSLPRQVTYLLDTYDTEEAARVCVRLAPVLAREGIELRSVRIDSGDLAAHARDVRRILDEGGLNRVTIFASGGLDEFKLAELIATAAPIDAFGVGTASDVSADAPYLDFVYKLAEYAGRPTRKHSEGKATWPGRKQIYRSLDNAGKLDHDVVTTEAASAAGEPLLVPVMRGGKRLAPPESLAMIRERVATQLKMLPARLRELDEAEPYRVEISPALHALAAEADRQLAALRQAK